MELTKGWTWVIGLWAGVFWSTVFTSCAHAWQIDRLEQRVQQLEVRAGVR